MKRTLAMMLAAAMLLAMAACSDIPEETLIDPVETTPESNLMTEATYDDHACTTTAPAMEMTSSRDDIEPFYPSVRLLDANGDELALYSELVYFSDGLVVGDGALILMSVSSRLPAIAEDVPFVTLSGIPTIEATARDGVSITGGETVNVYGEDFSVLVEKISLPELWEKGNAEWQGKTVYIYFTVTFRGDMPDYENRICNGYFVKVMFE